MNILVHHGKQDDDYYLANTPARLKAAQRCLFKQFDDAGYYENEDLDHLAQARSGNIQAIRGILYSRINGEYESWEIVSAIDPCDPCDP